MSKIQAVNIIDLPKGDVSDDSVIIFSDEDGVLKTTSVNKLPNFNNFITTTVASMSGLSGDLPSNYFVTTDIEGQWYYDATDTTSLDNYGTVRVTSDGKRLKRYILGSINVEWFGAKHNGVSDDATAINKAIKACDSGKYKVYLPGGTYIIGSPLDLYRGSFLHGAGLWDTKATTIKLKNGANCSMVRTWNAIPGITELNQMSYIAIENIEFNGNRQNQTLEVTCIQFNGQFVGSWLRNVKIGHTFGHAIAFDNGADIQIDHMWILNCVSTSGYGMTMNALATSGESGHYNINHLYIEHQRRSDNPSYPSYDMNRDFWGTAIRCHSVVSLNINEFHLEYVGEGIEFTGGTHIATVANTGIYGIGNPTLSDNAVIKLETSQAVHALHLGAMSAGSVDDDSTIVWIGMKNNIPSTSWKVGTRVKNFSYFNGYIGNGIQTTKHRIDQLEVGGQLLIRGVGSYSPVNLEIGYEDGQNGGSLYFRHYGYRAVIGSNYNGTGNGDDVDMLSFDFSAKTVSSLGPIVFPAPRSNGSFPQYGISVVSAVNIGTGLMYNPVQGNGTSASSEFVVTAKRGNTAPTVTPNYIGQEYQDLTAKKLYKAFGLTSSDWVLVN